MDLPDEDEEEEEQVPVSKRARIWEKKDISVHPLPLYKHKKPEFIKEPYEYFCLFFTKEPMEHTVYQSNLYARQRNLHTTFTIDEAELSVFIGMVMYISLPSVDDYWAVKTRVPQVADYMTKNWFKEIKRTIHFNDNSQLEGNKDRFYKIRPVFDLVTKEFLKVPATPVNSIDEVMVAYRTKAGNLRQYLLVSLTSGASNYSAVQV